MTSVINIKKKHLNEIGIPDLKEWIKDDNHIYIGRNMVYVKGANKSKWYNPFSVNKYSRDKALQLYENYIRMDKELMSQIKELKGKTLGCWCKPSQCHGDILVKILDENIQW